MCCKSVSVGAIFLALFTTLVLSTAAWGVPTEIVLYNFCQVGDCVDGAYPNGGLIFDAAGNLYGTATGGGANPNGGGVVFELSLAQGLWTETVLCSFCAQPNCADGSVPEGALIFDSQGNLYGTTNTGGAYGYGTVFELSPSAGGWTETVLYSFCSAGWPCKDSAGQSYTDLWPVSGVAMDQGGNLFGTAGWGTTFELSPSGGGGWTKSDLYFVGDTDPAGVALDAAGNVYGVAEQGALGPDPGGYVFELSRLGDWSESVLFGFPLTAKGKFADGYNPDSTLVFDKAGSLYGTTQYNGISLNGGNVIGGTVFKLTPKRKGWGFKVLHTFNGKKDGAQPLGALAIDSSGNVYGTSYAGGAGACQGLASYCGTVFEISPKGTAYTETVLWGFNNTDGQHPTSGVILDKAGNLYGTTQYGGTGTWANGVVFEVIP